MEKAAKIFLVLTVATLAVVSMLFGLCIKGSVEVHHLQQERDSITTINQVLTNRVLDLQDSIKIANIK